MFTSKKVYLGEHTKKYINYVDGKTCTRTERKVLNTSRKRTIK